MALGGGSIKLLLFLILISSSTANAIEHQSLLCIGKRCTYRLINPAVFSAEQLRTAASQSLTGIQHNRLNQEDIWVGAGSGPFANLEVAFYAKDATKLEELKKVIIALDEKYNKIELTPIRVTAQIYAVEESALKDIGFGIDGFWGGKHFDSASGSSGFAPVTGAISSFSGGLSNLLRVQFNYAVGKGEAMRIEDRSERTYHGSSFNFSDTQEYFRDGPVNTSEGKLGFEFSGKIFVDKRNKNIVNISDLDLYVGFAPNEKQLNTQDSSNKSPFGVRKIELPSEYDELLSGVPKVIYETIVYAHFDQDSFGLFSGVKRGGEASRLIIILTAEVIPEDKDVPDFAKETPDELRRRLLPGYNDGLSINMPLIPFEDEATKGSDDGNPFWSDNDYN